MSKRVKPVKVLVITLFHVGLRVLQVSKSLETGIFSGSQKFW
ncbi:Uncharacterised protein, partial [Mesomycoplasma hyorhinis]